MTQTKFVPQACGDEGSCGLSDAAGRYRGEKGCGTQFFFDPIRCTNATVDAATFTLGGGNSYAELCCLESITPVGVDRDQETDEGCLCDEDSFEELGPRTRNNVTVEFRDSLLNFCNPAQASGTEEAIVVPTSGLYGAWLDNRVIAIAIKTPAWLCSPTENCRRLYDVWQIFDACVKSLIPDSVTKTGYKTGTLELVPQSDPYCLVIPASAPKALAPPWGERRDSGCDCTTGALSADSDDAIEVLQSGGENASAVPAAAKSKPTTAEAPPAKPKTSTAKAASSKPKAGG